MQSDHRKYQVLEAVGKGGFGTVYRAQLLGAGGFQKIVALKVLNAEIDGAMDFAERLRDEARMLGLLQHRSIVRVDGLHQLNGRWTVVMEYVPGVDLKRLLTLGAVPIAPALELMEEVADALYSAFERPGPEGDPLHLLHRDIKPSNIHLTPAGGVKVLDFGVARADFTHRESVTRSFFFGSMAYMAPERLDGIDTHAGDVYALGSVLFELLSGSSLGRTSGHVERHAGILDEAILRLREVIADERIEALLRRAMAYEPDDRPTARELTRDIRGLRSTHAEPWLREWAEEVVPGLREAQGPIQDDLSGSILIERDAPPVLETDGSTAWTVGSIPARGAGETWIQEIVRSGDPESGPQEAAPETPAPDDDLEPGELPRRRVVASGLLAGVVLAMVLVLLAISAMVVWDASPWESETRKRPRKRNTREVRPEVATATGTGTEEVQTAVPDPEVPETPETPPVETVQERPINIDPSQAPIASSVEPKEATIRSSGAIVELWKDGQIRQTGSVPAGTYDIWAFFSGPDQPASRAGSVTVETGQEITLTCNTRIRHCVEVSY